jgi:hypothetical protein
VSQLLLTFPLGCFRPGGTTFCLVIIFYHLAQHLPLRTLLGHGDACPSLALTLQFRPQGLLASHRASPSTTAKEERTGKTSEPRELFGIEIPVQRFETAALAQTGVLPKQLVHNFGAWSGTAGSRACRRAR